MKFSCEKSILLEAIQITSRAVSNKSTINILEGLKITATDKLTLTGYDLSIGIKTNIEAHITQKGNIVLSAKLFGDIIRKLPNDIIYFETDENMMTTIRCRKTIFNLIALSAENFPKIPEVNREKQIKISQPILKSMISQTIFAVSDNESKPIHTGCLFEINKNNLSIVAVDGYRLSVRNEQINEIKENNMKFVVPGSSLKEIEKILGDNEKKEVSIYPDTKHILFEIENTIFITRLIEGEFLNYKAAIPPKNKNMIRVKVHEIINSIERVSLIVSERLKNPIRMNFENNVIKMNCITSIGKSYDECIIENLEQNIEIGFNSKYLLDALRACDEEEINLSISNPLNPMIIYPIEGNKFTYLVLPVRLKSTE